MFGNMPCSRSCTRCSVSRPHTGARRSEIIRSRLSDIDFAGQSILIREKKRGKGQRDASPCSFVALPCWCPTGMVEQASRRCRDVLPTTARLPK